jgi:DNA-binding response OmpR family regulator
VLFGFGATAIKGLSAVRLLLIEDSERLQRSLGAGLRKAGYAVDVVGDGGEGLRWAKACDYDVIVLDLMLPGLDGLTLLKRLREHGSNVHVLVLTAKDTVEDRVRGLQTGADDYLIKPFAFDELLARIQALLRRNHGPKSPRIRVGHLEIDTSARAVTVAGNPVDLAPREYALLEYLARRKGAVVTRADIERHIYDDSAELMSNAVDSAICALRRRIEVPGSPSLIRTRRGMGYILQAGEPR